MVIRIIISLCLICSVHVTGTAEHVQFDYLVTNEVFNSKSVNGVDIFCFKGEKRSLMKAWIYPHLKLASDDVDAHYKIFIGDNATDVYEKYDATMSSWLAMIKFMVSWDQDLVNVAPFKPSCIGIYSKSKFKVKLLIRPVDLTYFVSTVIGIMLLVTADRLSRHVLFYYGMGISVSLVGSVLIAVFIVSRFIPKKTGAAAIFFGGSSLVLYLFRFLWENMSSLVYDHKEYILAYMGITSLLSWLYLYYRGPPSDQRSLDLLKWSIQAFGLVAIYWSVQIWELTVTIILVLVVAKHFPTKLLIRFKWWWQYKFPPKRRFLTHEEYLREGEIETRKALVELREYCRSPDCNAWKTVSRLKSPSRFASFVEGEDHINDDELEEHFTNSHVSLLDLTSDESADDD